MNSGEMISQFLLNMQEEDRITAWHIALYVSLVYCWEAGGCRSLFAIKRRELMKLAHMAALPTYHKYLRDLVTLGLVAYEPSYNAYTGSMVRLLPLPKKPF